MQLNTDFDPADGYLIYTLTHNVPALAAAQVVDVEIGGVSFLSEAVPADKTWDVTLEVIIRESDLWEEPTRTDEELGFPVW